MKEFFLSQKGQQSPSQRPRASRRAQNNNNTSGNHNNTSGTNNNTNKQHNKSSSNTECPKDIETKETNTEEEETSGGGGRTRRNSSRTRGTLSGQGNFGPCSRNRGRRNHSQAKPKNRFSILRASRGPLLPAFKGKEGRGDADQKTDTEEAVTPRAGGRIGAPRIGGRRSRTRQSETTTTAAPAQRNVNSGSRFRSSRARAWGYTRSHSRGSHARGNHAKRKQDSDLLADSPSATAEEASPTPGTQEDEQQLNPQNLQRRRNSLPKRRRREVQDSWTAECFQGPEDD